MIEELLILVIAIAIISAVIILLFMRKPYSWKKEVRGDRIVFTFTAKKDIRGIELSTTSDGESVIFERKNIKKGEKIEFAYAVSPEPATLVVEVDGKKKSYAV